MQAGSGIIKFTLMIMKRRSLSRAKLLKINCKTKCFDVFGLKMFVFDIFKPIIVGNVY